MDKIFITANYKMMSPLLSILVISHNQRELLRRCMNSLLAQKIWENPTEYCEGWNFGPKMDAVVPVGDVATMLTKEYGYGEHLDQTEPNTPHEANLLMIDITKAQTRLGWQPRLSTAEAIALTAIANALTLVFAKILVNIKSVRKNFSE